MKGKLLKGLSIFLALLMVLSLSVGCNKSTEGQTPSASSSPSGQQNDAAASQTPEAPKSIFPLEKPVTLVYYTIINSNATAYASNNAELEMYKELERRTNVKVEFIHQNSQEKFNLMLASGDMADMLRYDLRTYPGGPDKAIADGVVLKLNDHMEDWCYYLNKYLKEHPDIDRDVKTDTGAYYTFPFIRGHEKLQVFQGPIIRKDWLDDLGREVPTTIDEWYTVLNEFKTKKGATAPLSYRYAEQGNGAFIGAYGVTLGKYLQDGKVVYGQLQPGFKDWLQTFAKWMAEGLLDPEYFSLSPKKMDENMTSGVAGASVYNNGSALGKWNEMMAEKDPKYKVVAAPYPTLKKGETPEFGQYALPFVPESSVFVYAGSPNKEIACRWLDYAYGPEGHMLYNFGIEGVSYTMVNGYPKYTDLILHNPDGYTMAQIMPNYMQSNYNGPFVQDVRYIEQYYTMQEQLDAMDIWPKTNAAKHALPTLYLLPEQAEEAANIESEVESYTRTMIQKFIRGEEPIQNYDAFVSHLKDLGIEKLIDFYNQAYQRYLKR